ncbi:hypothetical protein Pla22_23690 [Rubripirellula amarantea]|uniref:Uncharacterized protein n=1 Tax=Rubripirellula amarantea TaxID=2527999 RepID=A0A5C5WVX7_9BACT|nr:hypothetical protein [Rubripirellula amarantea]TWT54718.1 hypothetical protein Pla22_23690 [Rubripirellula amarantea]
MNANENQSEAKQGFLFDGIGSEFDFFVGVAVLVHSDDDRIRVAKLAFLECLLSDGTVSMDSIVRDSHATYESASLSKKIGPAIRNLQHDGLIRFVTTKHSSRKSRKGGWTGVWELLDRKAAEARASRLRLALSIKNDPARAIAESPISTNSKPDGNQNHETAK